MGEILLPGRLQEMQHGMYVVYKFMFVYTTYCIWVYSIIQLEL